MLPATVERVPAHTSANVNEEIRLTTEQNIAVFSRSREAITERLAQLEQEWDIERTLEANAASVCLAGLFLGVTVDRKWLFLPAAVAGFLLQHALQGWCPPLAIFRRLGVRTAAEIDYERYALKALRGDFKNLSAATNHSFGTTTSEAFAAARL